MKTAETIRYSVRQAQVWRDALWESVMETLEQRSPEAVCAIRMEVQAQKVHRLRGHAPREAILAWPYLDAQLRQEWIWACQYIQEYWIRGYLAATASNEEY